MATQDFINELKKGANSNRLGKFTIETGGVEPTPTEEYQEVEYIQSNGTQYIDTGVKPTGDTKIEIQFQKTYNSGSYPKIFGSEYDHNNQSYKYDIRNLSVFNYYNVEYNPNVSMLALSTYKIIFKKGECKINDTTYTYTPTGTVSSNYNIYLCAANRNNQAIEFSSSKILYCKIYEGETLVRDFIPCYRISDTEIGLYDDVNKVFYPNAGSGTFGKGNDVVNSTIETANDSPQNVVADESHYLNSMSIKEGIYNNGAFLGGIFDKTLEATLVNKPDDLDLEGKTISDVGIGVKYSNDTTEYESYDNFVIENIDDSETESTTTITAYGSGAKLDEPYNCTLDFSNSATHTVYEFYEDVCDQLGLTPTDATITNGTIVATNNPFTNKESCRTVLEAIEKVSCSLVDIDWKNQTIDLKWFSDTLDYEFNTSDYSTLEGSLLKYGPINTVIIGNSQVTGENVSQTDSASVEANGETQIMIDEPYFLYTQALRTQALPAIFAILDGFEYDDIKITTPYGKPFLKTGDKIKVNAPNGNVYNGYVMTHTITYNGAIQSIIESPALNKEERKMLNNINSSSIQNRLRRTELIVDKQNGEITALTSKTEQLEESIEVLSASLDTNIVIVSVNDSGYPFDNKTYEIDYSVKYLGEPLLSGYTISTSDSHTGITTNLSTLGKIKFAVANNTAITSEDNKYTFTISYTNSGTTYTSIRTVMVSTLVSEAEQNVIISALEPSDTSVLWYDLTDGILKKYNPIVFTYELTSDTTFGEAKTYYEKVDDEYLLIDYNSSTQKYTLNNGTVYSVGDTIPANTIYIQNTAGGDWSKVNSADSEIQNVTDMITGQNGLQSKYDDLESRLQDAEHDLTNKVDSNTFNEYKSEVVQTQTNYYTKDEINQIATGEGVDGVTVTAVISTTATFDKDGMHYQKSTGDTISTINYEGMSVGDKNNNELFFAGVRDGESKSIVQTSNLKSDTYIIFGNSKGRLQEFTDPQANKTGVGLFLI